MSEEVASLYSKIGADLSDFNRGLSDMRSSLTKASTDMMNMGTKMSMGLTLPLIGAAKAGLDTAMDYESASNIFQATTQASAEEMQRLGETARSLGSDMSLPNTSAGDAATAMNELAKAGLSVDEAFAAAKGTLQLAATDALSEAEAAEIAANTLNAFGLAGSEASRVADLLAATANASSAGVRDVADSMQMVSAVAASANIPVEDITAAIGEMANKGIKGSDAGTSLKQMILSLQAPTKKSAELMEELGVSAYDKATGSMKPLREVISNVSDKLGPLTQEQRNHALSVMFGSDAVRAANIVMMGGVDAYDKMHESVTREGAAAELSGARMKGLRGALAGFQSQVETLLLNAATPFLASLEGITRAAADFIPQLSNLDPNLVKAAVAFGAVLAAAGPLMMIVGMLGAAIVFLTSPIGLVVVAVGLLAAAWATNFGDIQGKTAALWAMVQPVLDQLRAWLQEHIPLAVNALSVVWNTVLMPAIRAAWNFISTTLIPILSTLANVAIALLKTELRALQWIFENVLLPAIRGVWSFIQDSLIPMLGQLASFVVETVGPKLQWLSDNVLEPLKNAFKGVRDAVGWVIDKVKDLIDALSKLHIPDAINPGSPTPFELGLRGIADAMDDIERRRIPGLSLSLARAAPASLVAGGGTMALEPAGGTTVIIQNLNVGSGTSMSDARRVASNIRAALNEL